MKPTFPLCAARTRCKSLFTALFCSFFWFISSFAHAESYGDWQLECAEQKCRATQQLFIEQPQGRARVMAASLVQVKQQKLMQLILPLGMDLRAGVVTRVDASEEKHFPFTTCLKDGCVVLIPLDGAMYTSLKAGKTLKTGFRPLNTEQTLVVEVSLKGFTKASAKVK